MQDLIVREPDRIIEVAWGAGAQVAYPVDISVEAQDRQGLLRDISDVLVREKINVTGVQTQSAKGAAWMTFTVEVSSTLNLADALRAVRQVPGVRSAKRR